MEREIFADGRAAGTLRTEPDGADTCFSLSCRLGPGLWRLWAEGTAGRLLLGTLEGGGPVSLRRRFSDRLVRPVGRTRGARHGRCRPSTPRRRCRRARSCAGRVRSGSRRFPARRMPPSR